MWFTALLPVFSNLIEKIFPDPEKAAAAQATITKALADADAQMAQAEASKMASQANVIVAEANSQSAAARNWRPHLMYCLMLTYPINWFLFPLLRACGLDIPYLAIPTEYWTVLSIGLGGYIGVDGIKSYAAAKFNNKKFFDGYRDFVKRPLSEEEVANLQRLIDDSQK